MLNDQIAEILKPWQGHYFRTHFLKFGPGGFFPPHRDWNYTGEPTDVFRLIMPLRNVNPQFNFVLEDKILHWEIGRLYFIDTLRMHYLFNNSFTDSYWLVVNVDVNQDTILATQERFNPEVMYNITDIKIIHLEVTTKCQARCPMCPRRIHGETLLQGYDLTEISLETFVNWFPSDFVKQLHHLNMCGNQRSIIAKDTLEIFRYLRETNPHMTLQMHTNGSARLESGGKNLLL